MIWRGGRASSILRWGTADRKQRETVRLGKSNPLGWRVELRTCRRWRSSSESYRLLIIRRGHDRHTIILALRMYFRYPNLKIHCPLVRRTFPVVETTGSAKTLSRSTVERAAGSDEGSKRGVYRQPKGQSRDATRLGNRAWGEAWLRDTFPVVKPHGAQRPCTAES